MIFLGCNAGIINIDLSTLPDASVVYNKNSTIFFCRFLQRATAAYVVAPFLNSVIHFALSAISLEHRDANASVMKFLSDLLHCGKSKEDKEDFEIRSATVNALKVD